MNKLLENTLGVIKGGDWWIEVLFEEDPPKKALGAAGSGYVYISKYYRGREVGNHSIGLPADKARELGRILLGTEDHHEDRPA
ncbi:MAG: hypothetical protein WBX11_04050 [Thiobacillaceae bacterium]